MTHLIALAALHILGRARLWALFRGVTLLLAVAASERIDALLHAVSGAMAFLVTIRTGDNVDRPVALNLLLLAVLDLY